MKRIVLFLALCCIISISTHAFYAASDSFRFEGTLKCGQINVPGMLLNVFLDGKKTKSIASNRQGNFALYLAHNKQYTVELIKKNYILQKIIIDTKVTESISKGRGIEMAIDNEIQVFEYFEGVKTEIFENPVLYYVYNENSGYFEQDRKKSQAAKLTSITAKINSQKSKEAQKVMKQATSFEKKKKYEEALIAYNQVLELTPNNQMAQEKIKGINKILKSETGQIDNNYKQYINTGDDFFSNKKYSEAIEQYKKAMALKPEQSYPKDQISYIDSILSQVYNQNKPEYDRLKKSGNEKLKNKEYKAALVDFETALTLLPDEPVMMKLIKTTKSAIEAEEKKKAEEQKAIDDKVNILVKKADDYSAKKDYANAIAIFNQALQIKPDNVDLTIKKEKANQLLIEQKKLEQKLRKEKNFKDTIALADSCFKIKDYEKALSFYKAAAQILPDNKDVYKKIKASELKIEKSKEKLAIKSDSAETLPETLKSEEPKVDNLKTKAIELQLKNDLTGALNQLQEALKVSKQSGNKQQQAEVINQIASVYYDSGMYKQTIKTFEEALSIKKELNDKSGMAEIYSEIGTAYHYTYQYDNSLEALQKALDIYKIVGNTQAKAETYSKIAGIYDKQNNFRASRDYVKLAITEAQKSGNINLASTLTNNLGVVYYKMGNAELAARYYNQVVEADLKSGNKRNLSLAYNNLGNVNFDWNKYETAISFYEKSLNLKKELNFEEGVAVSMLNIGNAYLEMKKPIEAAEFLNSGLKLALKLDFKDVLKQLYQSLAKLYETQNDPVNALKVYKILASQGTITAPGQLNETENMYTSESKIIRTLKKELSDQKILTENESLKNKQKEQQLSIKEMQLAEQQLKNTRNVVLLIFSLIVAIAGGVIARQFYKRYEEKRRYSEIIEFQKRQITDSIEYAGRIQSAVMPPMEFVKSIFPKSFILNKPKDILSGDFYFISTIEEKIYVAVADCTGHGVPGAFMSMLGYTLSKEVIQMQTKKPGAGETLNLLRDSLMKSLHQTGRDDEAKDGMDIALCIIDQKKMTLEYSGANNPCYIIRNKELTELKPDRMPIGIHPVLNPFSSHTFELKKNDSIYLFSDGFRDQIGESSLKKFKKEQFSKLLIEINDMSMEEQMEALNKSHIDWKGNMEQTDDIMVMGIKVW